MQSRVSLVISLGSSPSLSPTGGICKTTDPLLAVMGLGNTLER